jgi:hypothetical protein
LRAASEICSDGIRAVDLSCGGGSTSFQLKPLLEEHYLVSSFSGSLIDGLFDRRGFYVDRIG